MLTSYGTANSNGNLCYGDNNGIANVNASGGVPPYSFSLSNGDSTSIINDISDTEISISPNPFLDYTKVNIPNNNSLYSISIYNSIGELIRLKNNNSGEIIIRKGDLARGVYTLIVDTENEIIKKQIIIK